MTQEGSGQEPPDEFAHLFRPDSPEADDFPLSETSRNAAPAPAHEPANPSPAPVSDWEPLVAVPQATPQGGIRVPDPPLPEPGTPQTYGPDTPLVEGGESSDSADEPLPPADPKEGRLFRSRGAPERADAVTAIGSMQARRLRTMARGGEPAAPHDQAPPAASPELAPERALPSILPVAASGEPAPALQVMASPTQGANDDDQLVATPRRPREPRDRPERSSSGSLTGLGVYAVVIGVTVILAFGETVIFGGEPGIITGLGLLVVSVFAAFTVRTHDGINAIFAPAIAFFIAALTAGQVGINASGLTSRAVVVFFLLGSNWVWIVGSTAVALVIVALRRRVG